MSVREGSISGLVVNRWPRLEEQAMYDNSAPPESRTEGLDTLGCHPGIMGPARAEADQGHMRLLIFLIEHFCTGRDGSSDPHRLSIPSPIQPGEQERPDRNKPAKPSQNICSPQPGYARTKSLYAPSPVNLNEPGENALGNSRCHVQVKWLFFTRTPSPPMGIFPEFANGPPGSLTMRELSPRLKSHQRACPPTYPINQLRQIHL
jgi:hypothetical protein